MNTDLTYVVCDINFYKDWNLFDILTDKSANSFYVNKSAAKEISDLLEEK